MPLITDRRTIAANTIDSTVLSGQQYEFLPFRAALRLALVCDIPGTFVSFNVAGRLIIDAQEVPQKGVAGTGAPPVLPDDILIEDAGLPSNKLQLTYHNRTAGAGIFVLKLMIVPV